MTVSTVFALLLPVLAQNSPGATALRSERVVATPIADVVVHPGRARVTRRSAPITADGAYVVEGLTGTLDPASVRASVPGGHVLSVEVRPRPAAPPSERLEALAAEQDELDARRARLVHEFDVLTALSSALARMSGGAESDRAAPGDPAVWESAGAFLLEQVARDQERRRALEQRQGELDRLQADLDQRRGALSDDRRGTHVALVEIDVPAGGAPLELAYLVPDCSWRPRYELRATRDARSVDLVYRASVRQASGEDWEGVSLALSTAEPRRGAAAPALGTRWARLVAGKGGSGRSGSLARSMSGPASPGPGGNFVPPFAAVRDEGLSLRYELPATDTVLSGADPTSVLVTTAELATKPEYHCVPAVDPTVWLRGRATNGTDYALLPGRATVFFGEDHLGDAQQGLVRPGEEFTLHLGADPALAVERELVRQGTEEPGFFGSKSTWHRTWSIRVANHGAAITDASGGATVFVRESVPRPKDDRIEVHVEDANHPLAEGARWNSDREDRGIETWAVSVPRGEERELRYELRIRFPEGAELRFR